MISNSWVGFILYVAFCHHQREEIWWQHGGHVRMCANVPQQRLEHRPDDAAEDHCPAQPGAVCKATFHISQSPLIVFLEKLIIYLRHVIIHEMSRNTYLKRHLLGYFVNFLSILMTGEAIWEMWESYENLTYFLMELSQAVAECSSNTWEKR